MPVTISSRKFVWGWLRLFLGFAQMSLVAACVGSLMVVGVHPITIALVIAATAITITSRLLYRGKAAPDSEVRTKDN